MQRVFHLLCAGEGKECAHCPSRTSRWGERADDYLLFALPGSNEVNLRQNTAAPAGVTQLTPNLLSLRPQDGSAEGDFDASDMLILPPPELYADSTEE